MRLLSKIKSTLFGSISFCLYVINTLFWAIPIFVLSVFKLLPLAVARRAISYLLDGCATGWIAVNGWVQNVFSKTQIIIRGPLNFDPKGWYLVLANHQSWVDIVLLQRIFNYRIPFLKFFLKYELLYVPVLGLAWWALDFPFMRRYSKSFLAKYPHLKGKDLETTKQACQKFQFKPVSIMNFIEGTRFSEDKHSRQQSPFPQLLKPKSGGVGLVLSVMGQRLTSIIDVTIHYPKRIPSFWDFISGKVKKVYLDVQVYDIPERLLGNYSSDNEYRAQLQQWVNEVWRNKANTLQQLQALSR